MMVLSLLLLMEGHGEGLGWVSSADVGDVGVGGETATDIAGWAEVATHQWEVRPLCK